MFVTSYLKSCIMFIYVDISDKFSISTVIDNIAAPAFSAYLCFNFRRNNKKIITLICIFTQFKYIKLIKTKHIWAVVYKHILSFHYNFFVEDKA